MRNLAIGIASTHLAGPMAWAQARSPLLMEGKKTMYQRVLTRPGATLVPKLGAAGGTAVEPFSVYFVYERVADAGKTWLVVGGGSDGKTQGAIAETDTVAWKHSITLAFNVPSDRQRVLFFRDKPSLTTFMMADNVAPESQRVLKEITAKGTLGTTSPVIAAEPEKFVDVSKQFYLLPVLESSSTLLKSGRSASLVKVASITRDAAPLPGAPASKAPTPAPPSNAGIMNYNAAVVFVIDATSSMQPYIERTRTAMEEVLKQAEETKTLSRISFGLIAFQDDPAKTKGVEYLTKVFIDPSQKPSREQFTAAMMKLNATKSSTRAFAEDSYAALDEALRKVVWQEYGGKYVVFITDASAREGNSPFGSTRLSTSQIRAYAQERGVAIYTLHLKTAEGKADHAIASGQYSALSKWGASSLYFPVEAGDPAKFETDVKTMAKSLVEQVRAPDRVLAQPGGSASSPDSTPGNSGATIQGAVDNVGRAMVLAYLGRQQGVKSPPMYESWASDVDMVNGVSRPFSVRVLLTKNQLSDLQTVSKNLAVAFDKAQLKPATLFDQLRSAAVAMGRDPSKLGQGKVKTLEEAGLMSEYLDGLPYKSRMMKTDLSEWSNMSPAQTQEVIDNLRANVALYQRFNDDTDKWVKLNPNASDGDKVYAVPFDVLP